MSRPIVPALVLVAGALTAAGCTPARSSPSIPARPAPTVLRTPTTASDGGILVGPGPQADDTVQTQAAPGACHYRFVGTDPLPDPHCTPGAVDPQVTQANIATTICSSGFTASIRPQERITALEKVASAAAYGYTGPLHQAEYDHLIPLELGGDPNDAANLWVEPPDTPDASSFTNAKDGLETRLNRLVCSGQLLLVTARQAIATDWVTAAGTYDG
jgi:hypothetical protein